MTVLTNAQLRQGYELTIENGMRLLESAVKIQVEHPEQSLGLAQLGQEEIGKSLSLLASFALAKQDASFE